MGVANFDEAASASGDHVANVTGHVSAAGGVVTSWSQTRRDRAVQKHPKQDGGKEGNRA